MRNPLIITLLLTTSVLLSGQTPVGSWTDHLNYNLARTVAVGEREIFASTGSSLMVYNKNFNQLRKISRVNGLSETGISTIGWSDFNETLVVAYLTSNVDLIKGNVIYNIPDISRKYIPGKKTINKIEINGKYAYLACSFGIVLIDLDKKEIHDTWKPGTETLTAEVFDLAFGNEKIFAATSIGVFSADLNNPGLAYFGNWSLTESLPSPGANYSHAIYVNGTLYVNRSGPFLPGDTIYAVNEECTVFSYNPGVRYRSLEESEKGFILSTGIAVHHYNTEGSQTDFFDTYGKGTLNINHVIYKEGLTWIADLSSGLVLRDNNAAFTFLTLPGPVSADAVNVTSLNGKTIVCGGSVDVSWNNIWRPLQVSVNENNKWTTITSPSLFDPIRALIDPANTDHFFVSTWGSGLLEYENDEMINQFTYTNSPLQTIIPNQPFVRICGMAMDGSGNLWLTQTEVPGSIKALKSDGTWIVNPLTADVPAIGDMIIASDGKKWVVLPRGDGLFILDDKGTPENFADDDSREILITDNDNRIISNAYCIAEDLEGNIWIGTNQGPVIYYNPGRILENDIRAYRIKIPRNDGTGLADYMLGTETITSIAVDGANRKWLGTASSGAYLLSSDGTSQIVNYNESNSPLLSNIINSIAVDGKNGNVWFATSRGLISVRGDATEGRASFSGIYSFPNPVREDFEGSVTITGLIRDTQVRITDISGNLVYRTISEGGQASWDLTTYNGRRVSTGVYVVFCASPDGSQSCVTKILVIN